MTSLSFTVLGKPATKGSTKSHTRRTADGEFLLGPNGQPRVFTRNSNVACPAWEQAVGMSALIARSQARVPLMRDQAVGVDVVFYQPRPRGHYGSGRNAGRLLPSAPMFPDVKPDVDKYLRAILDPLTSVLYADDGQVVSCRGMKLYGEPARAEVRVWSMLSAEAPAHAGQQTQLALVA